MNPRHWVSVPLALVRGLFARQAKTPPPTQPLDWKNRGKVTRPNTFRESKPAPRTYYTPPVTRPNTWRA